MKLYCFSIKWATKDQYPGEIMPTTSRVFAPEVCALPLCYNRCSYLKFSVNPAHITRTEILAISQL